MWRIEAVFAEAERFELFTGSKSSDNIRLYQRLGYRVCREENLSPNVRLVFMEKRKSGPPSAESPHDMEKPGPHL